MNRPARPADYHLWPREKQDAFFADAMKTGGADPDEDAAARPPAFSDEALALRFAERHAEDLRFVAAWGKWLAWDGARWRFDDTLNAFDLARHVCREAAAECKTNARKAIASAKTVAAVVTLARADRRLAATVDQWDADPWLLNTPDAIVDLRSGRIRRPARRLDDQDHGRREWRRLPALPRLPRSHLRWRR